MKNLISLIIIVLFFSCTDKDNKKSNDLLLKKYSEVTSKEPDTKGKNVKVWSIKKTERIRINLVEMTGELSKHKHPDAEHSLIVLKGNVKVMVADSIITISENDFISIPKNVAHKYWTISPRAYLLSMDAPYYNPDKTISLE